MNTVGLSSIVQWDSNFEAKYYFDFFYTHYDSYCARDAPFLISNNQSNRWCGNTNSHKRNDHNGLSTKKQIYSSDDQKQTYAL